MTVPVKYVPGYSYSGYQANNPTRPLPAPQVDNDFANIATSVSSLVDGLAEIRRSDGRLKNGVVTPESLAASLKVGFTMRGTWANGTEYAAGDGVVYDSNFYSASVAHTAATDTNRPDRNDGSWEFLFSTDDIAVAGALSMPSNTFTGNGSQTSFTLTFEPKSVNNLLVTVGGVLQKPADYSVTATAIVFLTAPANGFEIIVRGFTTTAAAAEPADGSVTEAKLDTGVLAKIDGALQAATYDPNGVEGDVFDTANQRLKFPGAATYLRKTSERMQFDGRWSLFEFIDPIHHSAIRDGSTTYDVTARLASAASSGELLLVPRGLFLFSGLTGDDDLNIVGTGRRSKLKLANGANATMLSFTAKSNVTIRNLELDGNTGGQTATTTQRGIYFNASGGHCDNIHLADLFIHHTGGQGVMFSGTNTYFAGRYSTIDNVEVADTGHTGFNGGCSIPGWQTTWRRCQSFRPANQGFKTGGNHSHCYVEGNYLDTGEGEGFETEYVDGAPPGVLTYDRCFVRGAGQAFRLNGSSHTVFINGCGGEDIMSSVVNAFGNLKELRIEGLYGRNFGKRGTRDSSNGLDLVSLLDANTAVPTDFYIANLTALDDQGSPTGEYMLYVADGVYKVGLHGYNRAEGLKLGALNITKQNSAQITIGGNVEGWSAQQQDSVATTVGGSAGTYDLKSQTILRREFRINAKSLMTTRVYPTGTNGQRDLQFQVNALTAVTLTTWLDAEAATTAWIDVKIEAVSSTVVTFLFTVTKNETVTQTRRSYSISDGTDLALRFIAITGGTATMTQDFFKMSASM